MIDSFTSSACLNSRITADLWTFLPEAESLRSDSCCRCRKLCRVLWSLEAHGSGPPHTAEALGVIIFTLLAGYVSGLEWLQANSGK